MKKIIQIDRRADREMRKLPRKVQMKFVALLEILGERGKLEKPDAKKLDKDLYEMRVRSGGQWRSIYAYLGKDFVIVLSAFRKKSQKTPRKELEKAIKRLKYHL